VLLLKRYWRMEFFKISGDGRAVYAGREFWRLQWSSLCWGKIRLYMSLIKVPSFAGIGLLPIKLELYYLCRYRGRRTMVPSKGVLLQVHGLKWF